MDRTSLIAELNTRGLGDGTGSGPLYKRLAQALTGLVQEGLLKPGTALPGERDLAGALEIGRVTVRTAYRDLLASGVIESRHGSGTFVSQHVERIEQPLWRLSSFSADMRSRGHYDGGSRQQQRVEGYVLVSFELSVKYTTNLNREASSGGTVYKSLHFWYASLFSLFVYLFFILAI